MDIATIMHWVVPPVVGAVIGYFTNYIAVKMLFFPRREIRILGHRLPFTPGAIPKGKERLAKAAGDVVAGALLTREDVEHMLLSDSVQQEITELVIQQTEKRPHEILCSAADVTEETYQEKREQLCDVLSREILKSMDVKDFVREYGNAYLTEKTQNSMLKLILNEKRRQEIIDMLADDLQRVIDEKGQDYVKTLLSGKIGTIEDQPVSDLLSHIGFPEEVLKDAVQSTYRRLVLGNMDALLSHIHIAEIVTEKINAMSVEELEQLVLTMMKKELGMIVNLGALIGFVLGMFNLLLP
ncbi:MAG: DUF445 family protein [Oscillospiraceae bacterium]|nr:DUF445 family protein [Oscillospiraceae bacterium]